MLHEPVARVQRLRSNGAAAAAAAAAAAGEGGLADDSADGSAGGGGGGGDPWLGQRPSLAGRTVLQLHLAPGDTPCRNGVET